MDDKTSRRGLYRYNHIDQVCKRELANRTVSFPTDYFYSVNSYRPFPSSSILDLAEYYYTSTYPENYKLQDSSSINQLIDVLQSPMYAAQNIIAQRQSQSQQFPDICSEMKSSDFLFDSETIDRRFDGTSSRYKMKLIMWLVLLFVMVGIVVVVLILTISKMQAVSSTSLYGLRRFEGHFLVTEGPLLKFDGRLLQQNTEEFMRHANKIQQQLNRIYRQSDYGVTYAGSEVTQFRFVPAVPALDVTFILKIRPNTNINILNLLSVLRNYVRAQGFDGNTIDDKSISLENKHP